MGISPARPGSAAGPDMYYVSEVGDTIRYSIQKKKKDGEAFVKLGHIDDVLPNVGVTIHTFVRSRNHKVTTPWRRVLRWPDEVSR